MTDSEDNRSTADRLKAAKQSLQTARMSLGELERLRAETRGPLPSTAEFASLLGRSYDDVDVQRVLFPLGVRYRDRDGVVEAASRPMGVRCLLDRQRTLVRVELKGRELAWEPWAGLLPRGLTMTAGRRDVVAAFGPPRDRGTERALLWEQHRVTEGTQSFHLTFFFDVDVLVEAALTSSEPT